jgi:hypothetical protein
MTERPTPAAVKAAVQAFDTDEDTGLADRALAALFARYPWNDEPEAVLLKAAAVNALYSTNVYAVVALARHILALKIDNALDRGDLDVVEKLADFAVKGKRRRIYSFATKYCNWHRPETFPIYDSRVAAALLDLQKIDAFASFRAEDLQRYPRFVEVLGSFRVYYYLETFTFREIDKYLWRLGAT